MPFAVRAPLEEQRPATGFALYGAMGLKPGDLSSAAAYFIDGSVSNLILAYTLTGDKAYERPFDVW